MLYIKVSIYNRIYCEAAKYDGVKGTLLASCARAGEPACCQCHSSAAARWVMCMRSVIHDMKVFRAISIDLTLRGTVCQQSWVWQGGCTAQHLAKPYRPHSQEVPAGEPRFIYWVHFDCDCCELIHPPTLQLYCWRLFRSSCATFRTKTKCSRTRLTGSWKNLQLWEIPQWKVLSNEQFILFGVHLKCVVVEGACKVWGWNTQLLI